MTKRASLPRTAPFAQADIVALDQVIGRASTVQRAWLAGFLAGIDAANSDAPAPAAPAPQVAAPPKPKLTILYATESGNAEALATAAQRNAQKRGFAVRTLDMAETSPAALKNVGNLLVIASTWGEGEPPARAAPFIRALTSPAAPPVAPPAAPIDLTGVNFAVLALGDSAYAQFCETGRQLDVALEALGATRIATRLDCDLDYAQPAQNFIARLFETLAPPANPAPEVANPASIIHVDFHRTEAQHTSLHTHDADEDDAEKPITAEIPLEIIAEITGHHPLTSSRSASPTFHVELDLTGTGLTYEPGDSLQILPTNDPATVTALLAATFLSASPDHATIAQRLTTERDITTLTPKLLRDYAQATNHPDLLALSADAEATKRFLADRQVIDLVETFPAALSADALINLLRPLPRRAYSIASSQALVGEQAHLAIAKLAYHAAGRDRLGVASGMIAERVRQGDALNLTVKPNRHFRLPADPQTPIVMIGAGTGIAPYRAFLQHREALGSFGKGSLGQSWLIFGHRHFLHDFLYQLDIQEWLKSGVLSRLDLAFSRDQPQKKYVQHILAAERDALKATLADGAVLYLCGDAKAMARDVDATLTEILGADALEALIRAGRYKKDVY
jgi:sulfite reductase (NADPH) flavoprotein alpha-component